jgi:threonine dehydratase
MPRASISAERIAEVEKIIRPYVRRTPVMEVDGSDFGLDAGRLTLKLELLRQ